MILLDPSARPIIAHRGASAEAPENTLEAFSLAAEQGADAFELDVHLTRDGTPVVIHDPILLRTAGRPDAVRNLSVAALQEADAGSGYLGRDGSRPWKGQGVRVPTLREVLKAFPDMPLLIEIKTADAQGPVTEVLFAEDAVDRCVVASFSDRALDVFRKAPFLVGASRSDIWRHFARTRLGLRTERPRVRLFAVPDYWRGIEVPHPRFVAEALRHEAPVHVWTVDDAARAGTLWTRGVSGIITNRPGVIRAALASHGSRDAGRES